MRKMVLLVAFMVSIAANVQASPVQFADNGHYYDLVFFDGDLLNWQEALQAASTHSYLGMTGYLATVTSAGEDAFLSSTFGTTRQNSFAWLSGYQPNDDVWYWAAGPEVGTPFSYTNWGGIEPNDVAIDEDYLDVNIGQLFSVIPPGKWADAEFEPNTSNNPIVAYYVEYGGTGSSHVVPEPSSLLLLGFGGLFLRRKKR